MSKPQQFTHATATVGGKEYVLPMNPSDESVRRALMLIVQTAADSKATVHQRMALADDVLRIAAEELSKES